MPSLPPKIVTPAARQVATGGTGREAGAVVAIATSSAAMRASSESRSRSGRSPRQKAWLTTTLPCMPSARVRSRMRSSEKAPIVPGSWRWMSTGFPCLSASPKTVSRCRTGSRSMAQGSIPPTTSAPMASAASSSLSVPGRPSMPDCGKATIWISCTSRTASRVASTRSTWRVPATVSTSTWLRMRVVPAARKARASASEAAPAS